MSANEKITTSVDRIEEENRRRETEERERREREREKGIRG